MWALPAPAPKAFAREHCSGAVAKTSVRFLEIQRQRASALLCPRRLVIHSQDDSPEVHALVRQGRGTRRLLQARCHEWALALMLVEMIIGDKKWGCGGRIGCNFVP